MTSSTNILPELWEEIENKKQNKQDIKVLSFLNHDILQSVIVDGDRYWYEKSSCDNVPKYVYAYFDKLLTKKGYTYLYSK